MAKSKLTDALRAEIVARFAAWDSPTSVQVWLKDEHGIEVGLSALTPYHFDNPLSRKNGTEKWVELFDELRAIKVAQISAIRISHSGERLQIANDLVERLLANVVNTRGGVNIVMVEQILRQLEFAAKESGGHFTRERKPGPGDGTPETTAAEQAKRIREAVFQMDGSMNAVGDAA